MSGQPFPRESSVHDTLAWNSQEGPGPLRDLTGVTLGDFTIERLLGRGGMGEVYLAKQDSLNRHIALKVIRPEFLSNPASLARFEKEAWTAAKLNDPNVVHVYAVGSIDRVRFIAMEYVQGMNLKDYLDKKGPPELNLALSIMKQAGNAVRAAGEMGLIHRDIKPENILLTRRGLVKVADFGLCRDQNVQDSRTVTQLGMAMGTPVYMSPEQVQGMPLDHRSDLYSLGVTFYHMIAGRPPFEAETPLALALKHVKDDPEDLAARRPDFPAPLCRLVLKLMAKAPADRHQSAAEMLGELARIRESVQNPNAPSLAEISVTLPETRPSREVETPSTSQPVVAGRSGRRWIYLAAVGCLLAGLGIGWSGRPRDLLSPDSAAPGGPPALWISPAWDATPRQPTPEAQYHYAQIVAPESSREAAWIAVPGYHPRASEWVSRAYTQLGRELLQGRDSVRLEVFVAELEKSERSHDGRLGEILRVAVGVLRSDPEAVVNKFGGPRNDFIATLSDPALAELSLEITNEALRGPRREKLSPSNYNALLLIQRNLIQKMMEIVFRDTFGRSEALAPL